MLCKLSAVHLYFLQCVERIYNCISIYLFVHHKFFNQLPLQGFWDTCALPQMYNTLIARYLVLAVNILIHYQGCMPCLLHITTRPGDLEWFSNSLAQMFITSCRVSGIVSLFKGQGHNWISKLWTVFFVGFMSLQPLVGFSDNLSHMLTHQPKVQCLVLPQ